jgi:hypothetical protein
MHSNPVFQFSLSNILNLLRFCSYLFSVSRLNLAVTPAIRAAKSEAALILGGAELEGEDRWVVDVT